MNKKNWKYWTLMALAFIAYYVVFQSFYNIVAVHNIFPYKTVEQLAVNILLNATPILVVFIAFYTIIFRRSHAKHIGRKIAIDALYACCGMTAVNILFLYLMPIVGLSRFAHVDWGGAMFNAIFIFLGLETLYHVQEFKTSLQEAERQKRLALEYRYDALKAQVNPHFLFNSLSILNSLITIDQQQSREFVQWLSQIYRYALARQDCKRIPLREELDFMRSYTSILAMRYRNKFAVTIEGEERLRRQEIIPFTMQLLLENVTKHNVVSASQPMTVKVVIGEKDVRISNPIRPRPSDSVSHFGLRYLTTLYAAHDRTFQVVNDGQTFTAIVPYL